MRLVCFLILTFSGVFAWSQEPPSPKSEDYPYSILYDFSRDYSVLLPVQFEYEVMKNGSHLKMGPIDISSFHFNVKWEKMKALFSVAEDDSEVLFLRYPDYIFKSPRIEMLSQSGEMLWEHVITSADLENWKGQMQALQQKRVSRLGKTLWQAEPPATRNLGIIDPDIDWDEIKESFRFCLSEGDGEQKSRLCSEPYTAREYKDNWRVERVPRNSTVQVRVRNSSAALKNTIQVERDQPLQFSVNLSSGISYEFVSQPPPAQICDIIHTANPQSFRVVGWDIFPAGPSEITNEEVYSDFIKKIGFQSTIKEERQFWETRIQREYPVLYFPGGGGGVFKQRINLDNIPPSLTRIYLRENTPKATYWDSVPLYGAKHVESMTSSDEYSVDEENVSKRDLFIWNFKAEQKGEINRSYLMTRFRGKNYLGYFEVLRSFSNELSGRFSGVYQNNQLLVLGEVAYNFWLENLFDGLDSQYSFQRFGFSGKYFKSLAPVQLDPNNKQTLEVSVFDMKYRLRSGVWTRDETLGVMGSYQTFSFGQIKAGMLGVGGFWARSMPAGLDRWLNKLPYFNYPKWVDMELILYLQPMTANVTLGNSYSLNFHGQVLWTRRFFGEAGFGFKRYAILDRTSGLLAELNTFYGTVGLGIKF